MRIVVQYFEGCPHARLAEDRLREALQHVRMEDQEVVQERVETPEHAAGIGFRGSPTILIDGKDPFGDEATPVGYACRVYETEQGPQGAPSLRQLVRVLEGPSRHR
jgi:hypothetical protein